MLTALSLAAALTAVQDPPAAPPSPQVATRVMMIGGPGGAGHGSLDKDGDGQINREEFAAPLSDAFGRLDTNGDGRLSDEEMRAGHGGPDGAGNVMFVRHSADAEGPHGSGPHRFEIRARAPGEGGDREVVILTRGPDGAMTEVEGGGEVRVITRGGPGGDMRMHPAPGGEGRVMVFTGEDHGPGEHRVEVRRMGGPGGEAMHMDTPDMDRDGDGRVTEDEFLTPMREAFRRMDADRSGALEAGENDGEHRVRVFTRTVEHRAD